MTITVSIKANKKMEAYCKGVRTGEIGGLLTGEIDKSGNITVENAILLEQVKTSITFEISDDTMMDFTKKSSAKMLKSIIGWWHYHPGMSTFWSGGDDACFDRLTTLTGFCFGIVLSFRNKERERRCRMDMLNKQNIRLSVDDINVEDEEPLILTKGWSGWKLNWKEINSEIKNLVKNDDRVYTTCPTCKGEGYIYKKLSKNGKTILTKDDLYSKLSHKGTKDEDDYYATIYAPDWPN